MFHSVQAKHGGIRHRYLRAGNRFGKSDMDAAEGVAWCVGERTWYKHQFNVLAKRLDDEVYTHHTHEGHENHPFVRCGIPNRPVKVLLIVQDWDMATEIFTEESPSNPGKLWKLIPKDKYLGLHRNHSGAIDLIEFKSGSRFYIETIKSFKQDPQSSESRDFDLIIVDEPCPQEMYNANARGLIDRSGQTVFGLTPLREPWINDFFVPNKAAQNAVEKGAELLEGRKWMIVGSIHDNPYLKEEDIEDYLSSLSDAERACREKGLPLDRAGLIYKDFSYDAHVLYDPPKGWKDDWSPPENCCVYYAIDWHPSKPHAVLFIAVTPTGHAIAYACLFDSSDHTHEGLAARIHEVIGNSFVAGALCDPLAWTEAPSTGTTNADDLMQYGLFLEKAVKDPRRGIPTVEALLKRRDPLDSERGMFLVGHHLTRVLWEIDRYNWGEDGLPDKKQNFHMMEDLYRLVIHGLTYVEPPTADDSTSIPETSISTPDFNEFRGIARESMY
jgi:hypothetical protein